MKIQPAVNFDPVTASDPVWFVGENAGFLNYNQLKWINGLGSQPVFGSWTAIPISPSYYDMPFGQQSILAKQKSDTTGTVWPRTGSQLIMATVRKIAGIQYLWTCHTIGINSSGSNDGQPSDRTGIEWYQIQTVPSFQISKGGRIFDGAANNWMFYYLPSLAVNSLGDVVLGFSASSANAYIGAFYSRISGTGVSMPSPSSYFTGLQYASCAVDGWGDYSYSSPDPDGVTIWTVQECTVLTNPTSCWGTQVGAIRPFAGGP